MIFRKFRCNNAFIAVKVSCNNFDITVFVSVFMHKRIDFFRCIAYFIIQIRCFIQFHRTIIFNGDSFFVRVISAKSITMKYSFFDCFQRIRFKSDPFPFRLDNMTLLPCFLCKTKKCFVGCIGLCKDRILIIQYFSITTKRNIHLFCLRKNTLYNSEFLRGKTAKRINKHIHSIKIVMLAQNIIKLCQVIIGVGIAVFEKCVICCINSCAVPEF